MASAETTTIRVKRDTHERLRKQAELEGTSVTALLDRAVGILEEQRLLEGAVRSWEEHGSEMGSEIEAWDATLADGSIDE